MLNQFVLPGQVDRLDAVGGVELGENGGDVVFDRALGQGQVVGDFAVAQALGQAADDVGFAVGQRLQRGGRAGAAGLGKLEQQLAGDGGLDEALTRVDTLDGAHQVGRGAVFEQV